MVAEVAWPKTDWTMPAASPIERDDVGMALRPRAMTAGMAEDSSMADLMPCTYSTASDLRPFTYSTASETRRVSST